MRQNLVRILAVVIAIGSLAVVSAPKEAEAVSLNLINVWKMGDYVNFGNSLGGGGGSVLDVDDGLGSGPVNTGGPAWSNGAYPTPGINIHFGVGFGKGDQIVPFLGFAMQRRSFNWSYLPDDNGDGDPDDREVLDNRGSAVQFGIQIGAKFFFIERAKGKAPPFIQISFYKYVANIDPQHEYDGLPGNSGDGLSDSDQAGSYIAYDQAMSSPAGFNFAFGAEYYFNDNFSLGGEFFGIDFSWSTANNPDNIDLRDTRTSFSFYSSLTLTYRFSFSLRASVQFESDYDYED